MYCSNCGKELKNDAVFCDKCGTKVGESAPTKNITLWQDIKSFCYVHKPGSYIIVFMICAILFIYGIADLKSSYRISAGSAFLDTLFVLGGGLIIIYLIRTWKKQLRQKHILIPRRSNDYLGMIIYLVGAPFCLVCTIFIRVRNSFRHASVPPPSKREASLPYSVISFKRFSISLYPSLV